MDEVSFCEGTAEDFRKAVDLMFLDKKWLISYTDFNAYKAGCSDGTCRFIISKNSKGFWTSSLWFLE